MANQNKLSFRSRLTIYLTGVFVLFTTMVLLFQAQREKDYRRQQLETQLNDITELVRNFVDQNHLVADGGFNRVDSLLKILPDRNYRITIISRSGAVWYDSEVENTDEMENHLKRPEIQQSMSALSGSHVRKSTTTGHAYYYYAKNYGGYFIRTAALYNIEIIDFLRGERVFILYLAFLFVVIWIALLFITKRLADTITKLKDFSVKIGLDYQTDMIPEFPSDELGTISRQIVSAYAELSKARQEILIEKNKLFSHLNVLNEGIAFFTSDKKKILTNNRFIQYLNLISEQTSISSETVFEIKELKPIQKFIKKQLSFSGAFLPGQLPQKDVDIEKNNRYFNVQCIFFQDRSFEILIKDTTRLVRRSLLKQQMTSNIAHELKTPVTSILGYLDTLHHHQVDEADRKLFISRALIQVNKLTELIEDISTLNKITETKDEYAFDSLPVKPLVEKCIEVKSLQLEKRKIECILEIDSSIEVTGNLSLLSSVFSNLLDNAIKYGGESIRIRIYIYLEDSDYYYFSFSNTGNSIDEKHFTRIFERFYRVDDDRNRETGGTGLGLAIVKNAIELHRGEITARNLAGGGVEFLFTLPKKEK